MSTPDPFDAIIDVILKEEGGYKEAEPTDPGGETNFGISKRSYPDLDIKNLTREAAIGIYRRDFWDGPRISALPPRIALAVLDAGINEGTETAIRQLQRALGVEPDGVIGVNTEHTAWTTEPKALLIEFSSLRILHYTDLANFIANRNNWVRRIFRILIKALLLGG